MLKELVQVELYEKNPFVESLTNAKNHAKKILDNSDIRLIIYNNTHGKNIRQYNQLTASEAAVIMLDSEDESNVRDIVLKTHEEKLKHISELNGTYDSLQEIKTKYPEFTSQKNSKQKTNSQIVTL